MEIFRNLKAHLKYQVCRTMIWLKIRKRYPYIKTVPKKKLLKYAGNQEMCAAIFNTVEKEIETDGASSYNRGYSLLNAYMQRNPDLMLLALTGLTLEDIIEQSQSEILKLNKETI